MLKMDWDFLKLYKISHLTLHTNSSYGLSHRTLCPRLSRPGHVPPLISYTEDKFLPAGKGLTERKIKMRFNKEERDIDGNM